MPGWGLGKPIHYTQWTPCASGLNSLTEPPGESLEDMWETILVPSGNSLYSLLSKLLFEYLPSVRKFAMRKHGIIEKTLSWGSGVLNPTPLLGRCASLDNSLPLPGLISQEMSGLMNTEDQSV